MFGTIIFIVFWSSLIIGGISLCLFAIICCNSESIIAEIFFYNAVFNGIIFVISCFIMLVCSSFNLIQII